MMFKFDPLRFIADHAGMALVDAISEAYRQGQQDAQQDDKLAKIADLVEGTIDHFDLDDAIDLLYQIKEVLK